jgi:hypothetical protein
MALFAIPIYLYVDCQSPAEAQALKEKAKQLLEQPLVKQVLTSNQIPNRGFTVQDPVPYKE